MISGNQKILLVEDLVVICNAQAEVLEQNGYQVMTANSGEDAIEICKNGNEIDLILMDIDLGKGMDGVQTAEMILLENEVPIVFLSGHSDQAFIEKTNKVFSYGFVDKTSGINVLLTAIKIALRLFSECRKNFENKIKIKNSELRYRRLFESAQDGIFILDADNAEIMDVNPYLIELIGYTFDELIGKKLWEVSPFHDIAENKSKFLELQQHGYVHYENLPLLHKNGITKNVEFISNVYLVDNVKVIQCNIRYIQKRLDLEQAKVSLLAGKTTMLQELQHRIKNSLAIIVGLINMESSRISDPEMKEILNKVRNRIDSISSLYNLLNSSQMLGKIQIDRYIKKMIVLLLQSYSGHNKINLEMCLEKVQIDIDTSVSIGLILNELVTNIMKYAFVDNRSRFVRIVLKRKKENIIVEVSDNGVGLPAGFSIENSKGLGMSLIKMLSEQIGGIIENVIVTKGSLFRLTFSECESC